MATSLFAKAKAAAVPVETGTSKKKTIVPVTMGDALRDLQDKRDQIECLKTQCTLLEESIKPVAKREWIGLMKKLGRRPDSFILQSAGANLLVIIQDKYGKMTQAKEDLLIQNKLADIIEEKTEFSFDPVLLERHEKLISKAIEGIKGMSDDEKAALIVPKVIKTVRKGTIEQLPNMKNPELVLDLIEPTIQFKNQE